MPPRGKKGQKRVGKEIGLRSCSSLPDIPVNFTGGLKPHKRPSKQGGPPKKWVEQQWVDKEEVLLTNGMRVMCNASASSSGSSAPSQQGSSQQGSSQHSAKTVVIKSIKECRHVAVHCHKSLLSNLAVMSELSQIPYRK